MAVSRVEDSLFVGTFGTWTPVLAFGPQPGTSVGITYISQLGYYTRIGNLVFAACEISLSSKGSSTGRAQINGLPFPANNKSTYAGQSLYNNMTLTSGQIPQCYVDNVFALAPTEILLDFGSAGADSPLMDTNFTNTSILFVSVVYSM